MAKKKSSAPKRAEKLRMLIVEARYYEQIADKLLQGATQVLDEAGASYERITVPGALEVPGAIAMAVDAAQKKHAPFDGVVALGCVIQGETFHFDIVAMQSARALLDYSIAHRLPCGNGILTVDNESQAQARIGGGKGHKGAEAAHAALAMVRLKRQLAGK